jgi:hypothetical protein
MNKTLLVIGVASIAGAAFILACTLYSPLGALFTSGKTFVLGLVGTITSALATSPFTGPIMTVSGSAITGLVVWLRGSKTQNDMANEMASAASNERAGILSQANTALNEKDSRILSLETKVDDLTKQVTDTAQLKTEVATLQTKLSEAEQRAQRLQDEYNLAVRAKVIEATFPTGTAKH